VPLLRLGDAAVERTAGRRRLVIAYEDRAHGPAVYARPRRCLPGGRRAHQGE
jgi:hypothetical protein